MKLLNTDFLGATASTMCMMHCLATPFLFIAKSCTTAACIDAPYWWYWIDFIFLSISFFAVYKTTKTNNYPSINYALWISWSVLFFIILNEYLKLLTIPEITIYFPGISLVILHLYQLKYCMWKSTDY